MSNARDDKDRLQHNRKQEFSESVIAPSEEIGEMHFSTENYSTAIEYFQKALSAQNLKDYPDCYRLVLRISDCHRHKGRYKEAQKWLDQARRLLGEPAPITALGKIECREAFSLLLQSNYDQALKLGFSAYRRLKHSNEHKEVADVQLLLANCYHRLGLSGEAEDFFMDALSSYRRIDYRIGIAYVYNNLGLLHKNACRWNRSLASLSKSLELAKSLGLTQHLIRVQLNLGVVYAKLRRFSDALSAFTSAANMAERVGDQYKLTKALFMQGRTFTQCGDYCKAEKYILRAQTMANDLGYVRESALTDEYLGELMIARGKFEEAMTNLKNALRKSRQFAPEGDVTAEVLRRMADVYLQMNQPQEALKCIGEGLEVAENCGEFYEIGYFYRTKAQCFRRQQDHNGAAAAFKTSIQMFGKYGNAYEKLRSKRMLGRFWLGNIERKNLIKAKQLLSDCIVGFGKLEESQEQMAAQVLLAVVEDRLGNLDDALLALYEADRLADEEQDERYQKLVSAMRTRVETRMRRDTRRVLEQIPMIGNIYDGSRSRDKLVTALNSSLKLIMGKLNAQSGFVAIPKSNGNRFEVVCRENLGGREAKAILTWHAANVDSARSSQGLVITDAHREAALCEVLQSREHGPGTLVFQNLGFEDQALGVICIHQDKASHRNPIGQDALHFFAASSRLISLSIYELVRNERRREPKPKPSAEGFESIVTENVEMIKLLNLAERVAHSNATVMLQGETGTGKGLIAYAVHLLSERRDKRFVHINCAAMPEPLLESELFGHVKGAFTGASSDKEGLLRQADGGTIFLDEIGKTTLSMQGKLLQFLDSGKLRKVGSNELLAVNVRVICASKANLMKLCDEGRFLEDFFYRINDFPLTVPPLRKRREDVELLFFHYLRKFSREMDKRIVDVTDEALEQLRAHYWPGNVRELEKVVKRAVILADDGDRLGVQHLPSDVASARQPSVRTRGRLTLRQQIEHLEKTEIRAALERNRWNKSQTAIELSISYPSLLSKIKRYNLRTY
ncbi:MAG: sigma 54-interacting transcriptional regulator [Candidatus Krumholzibacteria bacterium]|nr:sigma 54-interacting transcriptional regulator [Candidatus Krumholzibacteria bacterium]